MNLSTSVVYMKSKSTLITSNFCSYILIIKSPEQFRYLFKRDRHTHKKKTPKKVSNYINRSTIVQLKTSGIVLY